MIATPAAVERTAAARKLVAVVNGRASGTAAEPNRLLAELTAHLEEAGATVRGVVTRSEEELRDLLRRSDGGRVVLMGGDGSLHAAANLSFPPPELALIPAGRANNVARALGIPPNLAEASRIAATAPARPLDVLRVEAGGSCMYCLEAVSAGLHADARAAYRGHNSGDLRAGARALAGGLRRYRPYRVALRIDGSVAYAGPAAQIFLSNLPYFGFGFKVNPAADPRDGMLEAIVLRARSRLEAARLVAATYRARHLGNGRATVRRAARAVLESPLPLVCDSTPLGVGSASVTVEPGRLRIASPWKL